MPGAIHTPSGPKKEVKKLVLCFDGTGNSFQGNTSDTNIVKIYDKLDRDDDNQYHYYQPGIGTYDISGGSLNKGPIGNITSSISKTIDSGIATTFDAHVMAGYRFLMRYYDSGDKIYMFGFSRGAFTARFLARMINTVGLLSKGNDEMVPFAYKLYQDYESARDADEVEKNGVEKLAHDDHDHADGIPEVEQAKNKLDAFTSTFCRRDRVFSSDANHKCYTGVKVYFLGIFDCVSSVKVLDAPFGRAHKPVDVVGTAEHVRHAVAVDEFRVKFKAALLHQDVRPADYTTEDVKEVWFPGNHGDVGGGWPARSQADVDATKKMNWFRRTIKYLSTLRDPHASNNVAKDPYQMSDIPLSWMIRELEILGHQEKEYALKWSERLDGFKAHFKHKQALEASRHNTMRVGRGASLFKVMLWNLMDFLPVFPRWELEPSGWTMRTWPPNMASARDIPKSALLHASLLLRLQNKPNVYKPRNNHGHSRDACLKPENFILCDDAETHKWIRESNGKTLEQVDHRLYALDQDTVDKYKEDAATALASSAVSNAMRVEHDAAVKPTAAGRRGAAKLSKGSAVEHHVHEITV